MKTKRFESPRKLLSVRDEDIKNLQQLYPTFTTNSDKLRQAIIEVKEARKDREIDELKKVVLDLKGSPRLKDNEV